MTEPRKKPVKAAKKAAPAPKTEKVVKTAKAAPRPKPAPVPEPVVELTFWQKVKAWLGY